MKRITRALCKRLGLQRLGRRRVRDLIDFIEDRQIDLVIDVGANLGQFGESLRDLGYRGRIVSFEPVQSAFQVLAAKAARDKLWQVERCAIGDRCGQIDINVSALTVFSSILPLTATAGMHDRRIAVDHIERVPCRTLDEVAANLHGNILLKIDTQGFEKQILHSAETTLSRIKGLQMELPIIHVYAGEWTFQEAMDFMAVRGFVLAQVEPVNYHSVDNVSAVDFDCLFRPRNAVDGDKT